MPDIELLNDYETKLTILKDELHELIERETLNSKKVYQLSVDIDKIISSYYRYIYQCV